MVASGCAIDSSQGNLGGNFSGVQEKAVRGGHSVGDRSGDNGGRRARS